MSTQGYPEGYWPQPPYNLSQEKSGKGVSADVEHYAGLAEHDTQMYSAGPYEQNGVGRSRVANFPDMNNEYEWEWQLQFPAMEGVRTADMPPAPSTMSTSRATLNSIPPHQVYGHPNVARLGPQIPTHRLGYPIQQVECEQFMGSSPILAPQPAGATNAESWVSNNDHGIADMQRNDWWSEVPFDGPGAFFGLEISEGSSGGGAGAFMDERYVGCVDESGLNPWTTSTAAAGEYGAQAQQEFPLGYTHGAQSTQSPFETQTHEYIEQNGGAVMPDLMRMHELTAWGIQPQHGASARAAGSAELSMPWPVPGTNVAFPREQSYPSTHEGGLHFGTHAGDGPINPLSTGVSSSTPQHWSGGNLLYTPVLPVDTLNASGVTLAPPNHQVTSVMAVNEIGDMVASPPADSTHVAVLNPAGLSTPHMSRTKTGRRGPKRGLPGRIFQPNLEHVQQRLRWERGDARAINYLRSDIFHNGIITRAGLKSLMTPDQRRVHHHGTQKYMLLVEIVPHPQRGVDHRCLLCPSRSRAEFKNREDVLRHLYKDHFGLSVDCDQCGHKFWLEKELAKHVAAKH